MPPSTPKVGVNDLKTLFPDIAVQAYGWDPSTVRAHSGQTKEWKCVRGHIYQQVISAKTGQKPQGCPYCANKKVYLGFNDLKTTHPNIAREADGWDPTTITYGYAKKKQWKCQQGHAYESTPNDRTNKGSGCPYCSGNKVLKGFNDLKYKFPDIAEMAEGWDPEKVLPGSGQRKKWRCPEGHIFSRVIHEQVIAKNKCPDCPQERKTIAIKGVTDLWTTHPEIAQQADGWDPSELTPGSNYKKKWICDLGHHYESVISNRTLQKQGCPYCANKIVRSGFNDLSTKFPGIAKEADGWDPSGVLWGTTESKKWKCPLGHKYEKKVSERTVSIKGVHRGVGCPVCAGRVVVSGFNDLATHFPDIAKEAYGWDPISKTRASAEKMKWKCPNGHIYSATIGNRTNGGSGCPSCCEYGFNPTKDTWLYLMARPGEQQFGITNVPSLRKRQHASVGWVPLDWHGPAIGYSVLAIETELKRWLRNTYEPIEGTTENWQTTFFEVQTLKELCALGGVDLSDIPQDNPQE